MSCAVKIIIKLSVFTTVMPNLVPLITYIIYFITLVISTIFITNNLYTIQNTLGLMIFDGCTLLSSVTVTACVWELRCVLESEVCGRGYPLTRIRRFSCGRSADPPNKHVCGCGPSADLKPRVLLARPTSNGSASVPVLSNLRTDPYLDTAVGYVVCKKACLTVWVPTHCLLDTV